MTGKTKMAGVKGNPIYWYRKKSKDELIRDFQRALLQNDYNVRSVFKVSHYAKKHLETNPEYFKKHPIKFKTCKNGSLTCYLRKGLQLKGLIEGDGRCLKCKKSGGVRA